MGNEIQGGGNHELSTDINTITAEINAYQRVAGEAIFEIGRRLKYVKENDLAHGEWTDWCKEEIGMSVGNADKFIVVFERLGVNHSTSSSLGMSALYEIATLPPEHREQSHTVPSTGADKKPEDMRETNYIGKKPEVLEGIMGEVKGITDKSYRSLMYSATNNQPEVYIEVYNKLTAIFKYNVKDIGKKKILTKDNRGYTKPQKSYLNTIILDGKKEEAAAIALDIIRNK